MPDKIPTVTESALSNNGARTVIHAILAPGATTYSHYHTLFSETFTLLSGSMSVYTSPDQSESSFQSKELKIGESVTVAPGQLHKFLIGEEETTNKVIFEPGTLDFERAILVMRGTQRDGIYQEFSSQTEDNAIFMAVMGELLNAFPVGEMKPILDGLYQVKGEAIAAKKKELVGKYASDEQLREALN